MADPLLAELLAKPIGPAITARKIEDRDFTSNLEVRGEEVVAELRRPVGGTTDHAARKYLEDQGLDPNEWEQTGYRRSQWTMPNGEAGESARYTFKKARGTRELDLDLDELLAAIDSTPQIVPLRFYDNQAPGPHTLIVGIGDMQFGKTDGDGIKGTLRRTINCLNNARDRYLELVRNVDIDHVHIAWLGDHVEGFTSQGGANVWRTQLTLTEQIRLTRRVMLHAMLIFAPLVPRLTMAAVPGNHGETTRFAGKGVTRYDDSHDTESLIAVADAASLNPERFGHVEFYVPETDELTVVVECNGTVVAHAHGHQWNPNKHFDWWRGQAFNQASAMHMADLLLAGHLHHEHIEADGPRTFIGVPSMESESTWFRHSKGTPGAPGLIVALTQNGNTDMKMVIRSA